MASVASLSAFSAVSASRTSLLPAPRSGCCSRSLASNGLGPSSGSAIKEACDSATQSLGRHLADLRAEFNSLTAEREIALETEAAGVSVSPSSVTLCLHGNHRSGQPPTLPVERCSCRRVVDKHTVYCTNLPRAQAPTQELSLTTR